jgi:glycosyltransferase involved in cell wall biosynthesis
MKVCYIADGASSHTQRWLNYFALKGYEVHLICWKIEPGYNKSINIHMLKRLMPKIWPLSQFLSFAYWCFQVRQFVNKIKPDLIDGQYVTTYGFLAACIGFHPLIITAWGSDILIGPRRNPIYKIMTKYALKKANLIICTGLIVKHEITKLGIDPNKVYVIVIGGVNKEKFHHSTRDEALMKKLGIGPNDPVVISTRNLRPVYDVATLIRAVPIILTEFPTTKFIIIGQGKQENRLRKLAARLGILSNVIFIGWIDHDKLPSYLSSSDIYISTSLSDGTSNSLLEAMACKLAPIVSDIPANRQWIKESENGFLFPIGDHITMAEKVIRLLGNSKARTTFGSRNRRIIELKADPVIEMQKYENIYTQLV